MPKILLVEDDVAFCRMLESFLKKKGFLVSVCFSGEEALRAVKKEPYDIVLADVRLPEKDGTIVLEEITEGKSNARVILMTGYAEVSLAVDAIKKGAFDYISKPISPDQLLKVIESALGTASPNSTSNTSESEKDNASAAFWQTGKFVRGTSDAAKKLDDYIQLVAPTNMSVLIIGDSGTGKEFVAKNIHDQSKRSAKPFVAVDCGAIPKEIAASEFFGHVKGSFTGAVNDKTGHFEAANGGTLFLDEIGNLNYELQVQLLRALQERKIKPVGSNAEIEVDIRVITATNEDLEEAVKKGDFREDLFHRLNEFSIKVPKLKNRKDDLMLFSNHFLNKANAELEKEILGFDDAVMEAFERYPWPGNLRELQNVIKRSVLLETGKLITLNALPSTITTSETQPVENYNLFKNKNEQELILDALEKSDGNKSKTARLLKIDRKTLYNKMKQYGINL
ncbi:MAG TPA: sigma-54 dependent transcriptional regulator [Flavobacteriaceae bacterium]|nr:sigma-54 dependent transcriptional regulator [Flavobacteriaceae bacterium]